MSPLNDNSRDLPVQGKRIIVPTYRDEVIPKTPDIVESLDLDNFSIPVPPGKSLLPFQDPAIRAQLRFMKENSMKGVYNGYEVGMGKSIMAITIARNILRAKRILVLCPSGLRGNWEDEIREWSIEDEKLLSIHTLYSARAAMRPITATWCICSYALLLKQNVFMRLMEERWDFIICDEAKELKNMRSKRTVLALELWNRTRRGLWMDATPMTRSAQDFYSACHVMMPETFTSEDEFCEEYCRRRTVPWGRQGWEYFSGQNLDKLSNIIRANFFVRKRKDEVMYDLPDVTYQKIVLDCGPFDSKLTEQQERTILEAIKQGRDPNECARPEDKKHISERRLEAGLKTLKEGKDFIGDFLSAGIPVVVVAYHRAVIDQIMHIFEKANPVKIDGSVIGPAKDRSTKAFNSGQTDLIVLQIKSAVGINLQHRCSIIIFVETSYDPTQIEQAVGRLRRIGQKSAINAYFFIAKGSVDEEVFRVNKAKLEIIDQVVKSTDE